MPRGPAARGCIPLGHKPSRNDFICQVLMDHTKPMKREKTYSILITINGYSILQPSRGTGGSIHLLYAIKARISR
jgi:hypothetical protein